MGDHHLLIENRYVSYDFLPHILQPTRITDHTATLIDNIFFNSNEFFSISGSLVCDLTDHLPNFLFLNTLSWTTNSGIRYTRDYSNLVQEDLLLDVKAIEWDNIFIPRQAPSDADSNSALLHDSGSQRANNLNQPIKMPYCRSNIL